MKYIFLDSNIFFNNWFLQSANFKFLANYFDNSESTLLMSELVCEEVQNLHDRGFNEAMAELDKSLVKIKNFNKNEITFELELLKQHYEFKRVVQTLNSSIIFIPYDQIQNTQVVPRAIKKILPFRDNDKGYRDTLIWLSFLEFIKKENIKGDVIFITENYTDFYDKQKDGLHDDLQKDTEQYGIACNIIPHLTLQSFIETLPPDQYKISITELSDKLVNVEKDIEDEIISYINNLDCKEFQKLLLLSRNKFPFITTILSFKFEMDEGMEDFHIISWKKIEDNKFYINCEFELRTCLLILQIPMSDYAQSKQQIENYYHGIYFAEGDAYFEQYIRPHFQVNFIFDMKGEHIDGLELVNANFDVFK